MADDPQRNFRSAYYEKVGFRGVEEKKSLEILLKDSPLGAVTPPPHSPDHITIECNESRANSSSLGGFGGGVSSVL